MADLELEITVSGDQVQARRSPGGGQQKADLPLRPVDRDLIQLLDRLTREPQPRLCHQDEFEAFGALLYDSLLDYKLDNYLRETLKMVGDGDRLRLQLVFDDPAYDLSRFPWEFLYAAGRGQRESFFLATHPKLVLSRYLPRYEDRPDPPAAAKPLRLLVIVSRPQDPSLGPVIAKPVADAIKGLEQPGSIQVQVMENPLVQELDEAIQETRPHIVHYIGHGMYDERKGQGALALVDDDGKSLFWLPEQAFASLFDAHQPQLVFLQACEGAVANLANNFAGLAPQLMDKNIPAVVAMQYPVSNMFATDFSLAFYRELFQNNRPYDHAVQIGRRRFAVLNAKTLDTRDFATPVLYMRSRNGRLWPAADEVK